tara:strand:+ start:274 stop:480 length:207 start_codon:yes stop_codon:yes gene_type:complete
LLSQALRETDPTALMPFDFLKLIWTALIGDWFFAKIPDISTWISASVIFVSGLRGEDSIAVLTAQTAI